MKVLRVVGSMNPEDGGVVAAIDQAALYYAQAPDLDIEMSVLCCDPKESPWLAQKPYPIVALGRSFTGYGIQFKLLTWLNRHAKQYDLVILDGLWQFLSWAGYLLKAKGVPYAVFTHGMLDPYFNEDKKKYLKKLPFWWLVERQTLAGANGIIFTCEEEYELSKKSFPCYRAKPVIAPLGIEPTKFKAEHAKEHFLQSYPELKKSRVLLFLSRIHPKKGLSNLLKAIAEIKLPEDMKMAIAGPDDSAYARELKQQAIDLNIDQKIIWCGMLEAELKWGAFYSADAFILPSHQENFGIVVAEAMSVGCPVLITNKVNIWREIKTDGAGLVEKDTLPGVKELLQQWLALAEQEKESYRQAAKESFNNRFLIATSARNLALCIKELVQ